MLTYLAALKVFNAGSPSWCVPRRNTEGANMIQKIRKGEKVKTTKELREELEKKTKSSLPKTSMKISLP